MKLKDNGRLLALFFCLCLGACSGPSAVDAPVSSVVQWIDSLHVVEPAPQVVKAVPEWAEEMVWYQIFPERFPNGDPSNEPIRKSGGDMQAIADALPYLDSLGVKGICLNPGLASGSINKTDSLLFDLVDRAHDLGMRVVIDGAFGQAMPGSGSMLQEGRLSRIFETTRRWMDPDGDGDPSDGVDGWRLEVLSDPPIGLWQEWNRLVRSINPEVYTVADTREDASEILQSFGFSAATNHFGFAIPTKSFFVDTAITASEFVAMLDTRRGGLNDAVAAAMQNLAGPHYMSLPDSSDGHLFRLMGLFQFVYVGAPVISSGTEAGIWNVRETVAANTARLAYYADLAAYRNGSEVLQRGTLDVVTTDDSTRTLAFVRYHHDTSLIVVLNRSQDPQTVRIEKDVVRSFIPVASVGQNYRVALVSSGAPDDIEVNDLGGAFEVSLPGVTGVVFESEEKDP